jgi:hypothetical protein
MDWKFIEELLDKYYNGETTLEEEKILTDFFRTGNVPAHLKHEKMLFGVYETSSLEVPDVLTDEQIMAGIANRKRTIPALHFRSRIKILSAIAAGVLLVLGLTFFLKTDFFSTKKNYGTYDDPQIAYAQTKKALMLISGKLSKGSTSLSKISKFTEMQIISKEKK